MPESLILRGIMEMAESNLIHEDRAGLETLELFSDAGRFNRWMFERIEGYCEGAILEIGSGIGNMSAFLLERFTDVTLSDIQPEYCRRLGLRFIDRRSLKNIFSIDLAVADPEEAYPHLMGRFDTVVALNVVEHVDDHVLAIRNAHKLLKSGGRLIVLVPAYPWLYNPLDKELGHFRRYTRQGLAALLTGEGLRVSQLEFFNAAAIGGWWMAGSVLRMDKIKRGPLRLYNSLVGAMRLADKLTGRRIGLSIIAVASDQEGRGTNLL
jgi:SAM-dependent methyltransferase